MTRLVTSCGQLIVCPLHLYCQPIEYITCKIILTRVINISSTCVSSERTTSCSHGFIWLSAENLWWLPSLFHIMHIVLLPYVLEFKHMNIQNMTYLNFIQSINPIKKYSMRNIHISKSFKLILGINMF